jgi:hypothetical protein
MCFPTFWEFQSYTLGVFKTHFPYTLGVLPFFFCLYVGILYLCNKSNTYEKEATYYQK